MPQTEDTRRPCGLPCTGHPPRMCSPGRAPAPGHAPGHNDSRVRSGGGGGGGRVSPDAPTELKIRSLAAKDKSGETLQDTTGRAGHGMWGDLSGPRVLAPSCVLCVETQAGALGGPAPAGGVAVGRIVGLSPRRPGGREPGEVVLLTCGWSPGPDPGPQRPARPRTVASVYPTSPNITPGCPQGRPGWSGNR